MGIGHPSFALTLRGDLIKSFKIVTITGLTSKIENAQSSHVFKSYLLRYDSSGKKISQQKYDPNGKTINEWMYDRPLKEISYESSGRSNYAFEFVYDNAANWLWSAPLSHCT
jgi:hypothetical protein